MEYADQLTVLAVNFDSEQGDKLLAQVEKLGIEFPSLQSDPRAIWSLKPVSVLPETLIIDSEGVLVHCLIGPQTLESLSDKVIPSNQRHPSELTLSQRTNVIPAN